MHIWSFNILTIVINQNFKILAYFFFIFVFFVCFIVDTVFLLPKDHSHKKMSKYSDIFVWCNLFMNVLLYKMLYMHKVVKVENILNLKLNLEMLLIAIGHLTGNAFKSCLMPCIAGRFLFVLANKREANSRNQSNCIHQ